MEGAGSSAGTGAPASTSISVPCRGGAVSDLLPKRVRESTVETTALVLPQDTNPHGTMFGGHLMALIDTTAAVAASRHARALVVTAAMDELHFLAPVMLGDILMLRGSVNMVGTTSMEVGVRVEREDRLTGRRDHAASAYLTFVALDASRRPQPVPPLIAESDDERRRMENAGVRRADRLRRREAYRRTVTNES
ncbi:MAG: acyl-CoA thioesterase [Candidatus Riflebacteria bacterium]|nr:acyl-CoA thioesterase [Candidatus Riflebacteria bacterium]